MTINCPNCGAKISQFAYTCPHCGAENKNRKQISDIEIEGDYEPRYFSYVPKMRAAEAVELKNEQQKKKRAITAAVIGAIALVIIIIAVAVYTGPIQDMRYEAQVEDDTAVLEECEQALKTKVADGKAQWSETMADYIDNGSINLLGKEWNVSSVDITTYGSIVWTITLECTTTGLSSLDIQEMRDEINHITNVTCNYFFVSPNDKYVWKLDKELFIVIKKSTEADGITTLAISREAN